jgi:CHASE3 domain sensor protein
MRPINQQRTEKRTRRQTQGLTALSRLDDRLRKFMTDEPTAQEIVESIKKAADSAPTAHDKAAPLALYHFARFIKEVSDSAEKQTRKVVNLTYALFWLTTVLLIVALIQLAIMWPQNSEEIDAHDNKAPNNQNN